MSGRDASTLDGGVRWCEVPQVSALPEPDAVLETPAPPPPPPGRPVLRIALPFREFDLTDCGYTSSRLALLSSPAELEQVWSRLKNRTGRQPPVPAPPLPGQVYALLALGTHNVGCGAISVFGVDELPDRIVIKYMVVTRCHPGTMLPASESDYAILVEVPARRKPYAFEAYSWDSRYAPRARW